MASKKTITEKPNKDVLVIVESPSKAKTIKKYLGAGYEVKASVGHIRDLPKSKIGFDDDLNPTYEVSKDKDKVIAELKREAKKVKNNVILATDPDREGEAIAWHINSVLGLGDNHSNRIFFTEITKDAVQNAITHPRPIDMALVNAQQARRVLDRIVGYKLSPLLWTKIRYGLSAGRVQSVAVRLIVDREREREKFIAEEYWDLKLDTIHFALPPRHVSPTQRIILSTDEDKKYKVKGIEFELSKIDGKKYVPKHENEVKEIIEKVKDKRLVIKKVETKVGKKYPKAPFTTSTLQQAAINRLGFTSKRTMGAAQKLYEQGFITYMRTDSTNLAQSAIDEIRGFVRKEYGDKYLPETAIHYKTKSKSAQEAHEAIRPTHQSLRHVPENMRDDEQRLYDLIWRRTAACQMTPAEFNNTNAVGIINVDSSIRHPELVEGSRREDIQEAEILRQAQNDVQELEFSTNGSVQIFDGFQKAYGIDFEDRIFPFELHENDELNLEQIVALQHFTEPPARYNEASLVKALEKYGIGRPSTYASIISTIQARGYVDKDGKALRPTDTGIVVNDFLVKFFPTVVDRYFTAEMEGGLDQIAEGKSEWKPIIRTFYDALIAQIEEKKESIKKEDLVILGDSDEKCDECGAPMKIKLGRYGKFLTCSRFPECKGIKSLEEATDGPVTLDEEKFEPAPMAKDGETKMVLKKGRFGIFWAHPDYPKVKETLPLLLKEICPECGHHLVERKGRWGKMFKGCSHYPDCKYIQGAVKKNGDGKIVKGKGKAKSKGKASTKKP
jgi:DNA topoisomerase-1